MTTTFMTIDQEQVMRRLYAHGIDIAKAKAFAIFASGESFVLIRDCLKSLSDLFDTLDDALPDDSNEDVSQLPVYLNQVTSTVQLFQALYETEVTEGQYTLIRDQLDPRLLP